MYRTRGDVVHLADRVRENLLMDAATFVRGTPGAVRVGFVVRAQRSDFPADAEEHLFVRARQAAAPAVSRGYTEVGTEVHKVKDPGDAERTLDTWCEVSFELEVGGLEAAVAEARFALGLEKAAAPPRPP